MKVAICSFQEIFYRSGEAQVSSRVHFKAFVLINTWTLWLSIQVGCFFQEIYGSTCSICAETHVPVTLVSAASAPPVCACRMEVTPYY